ncbi:MAG TPA: response regulator, partial [Verrucomicrobiota bacterium]|nr:response regulator [Verrucomicrobiota bacterium]
MKKILIIEDDQIVATIYRNKLSNEGFEVATAPDAETGLEKLNEFHPDLFIVDLILPRMSGTELLKSIRSREKFSSTPIIVFSNTYLTNMVQEAWKAGASKCLSKASCTPRQLIEVVRSLSGETVEPSAASGSTTIPYAPLAAAKPKPEPDALIETEQHAELRAQFLRKLPSALAALRAAHQNISKADNEQARLAQIKGLYNSVRALTGGAGASGMALVALVCDALEALLKELGEKPANINVSTIRTVAATIDFLALLCERAGQTDLGYIPPAKVLVVDDEVISRRAIMVALEKVKLDAKDIESPEKAFDLIITTRFDLIFLDVDMPGMNGFELCTKIRGLPAYKKVPVVFVTGLTDFESRASSMMSGGNDFIGKPFLLMELAVKALVYVLRGKLE